MSCERFTSAIVDHACGAPIAADAAAHLSGCEACRQLFDEQLRLLQDVDRQLALALEIEPSASFVPGVLAHVKQPTLHGRNTLWWSAAAAAAVVMLVTFGSLRSGERRAADRHSPEVHSKVASLPAAGRTAPEVAPTTTPGPTSRLTASRRRVDHGGLLKRPDPVEPDVAVPDVVVPAAQSRAIAHYLALVRRGALETPVRVSADETDIAVPSDLVIAPLSVDDLAVTDVENGIDRVDRRGPRSR
jgi:hypothetical protein